MIVYTAVLAGYDHLESPEVTGNARWVCFTNGSAPPPWEIRDTPYVDDPRRAARRLKLSPFKLFPDAEIVIWQDGNVHLTVDPEELTTYVDEHDIAFVRHPRSCLYDEARACLRMHKGDAEVIEQQVQTYRDVGCPEGENVHATFLTVRRNTLKVRRLNALWLEQIEAHSCRDQIALPYCLWKLSIEAAMIPGSHKNGKAYVRKSHGMRRTPLMTQVETRIVTQLIETVQPRTVLEWGGGGSTLYWPPRFDCIERWVTVEHDERWYGKLKRNVGDKVSLLLRGFPEYYQIDGEFDFIIVDGRERVSCLEAAAGLLSQGGVVVLHDASRPRYRSGWEHFAYSDLLTEGAKDDRSKHGPWRRGLAAFANDESIWHRIVEDWD